LELDFPFYTVQRYVKKLRAAYFRFGLHTDIFKHMLMSSISSVSLQNNMMSAKLPRTPSLVKYVYMQLSCTYK